MGFLSGLFRSRDAPRNSTSGSAYRFFMGNSTSGKRVSERSAMQMTAVYSCVRILSEAVAGLPRTSTSIPTKAARKKRLKIRCIFYCMMSLTRR